MKISSKEQLKQLWFDFFREKGFELIANASLVPENDPTVLFTTAGMHPLVPYLLGEKHPKGKYLCNVQRCVRTNDIDEVGDASHLTFFEMLGNWTMGELDKEKMIGWSFEFLTGKRFLGIDKEKLAVSVFEGDENSPRDEIAYQAWKKMGMQDDQIFYLAKEHNWWALGSGVGPCGPDTEMFFVNLEKEKCGPNCSPACSCGRYMEIWNDVFMQYYVNESGECKQLANPNIDTGMGLERTLCVLNGVKSVYDVGAFKCVLDLIKENSSVWKENNNSKCIRSMRIIADHLRTATQMIADGVVPSPSEQGYVLRRLIRRSVNQARVLNLSTDLFAGILDIFIDSFKEDYPNVAKEAVNIKTEIAKEVEKFNTTVQQGAKEFEKVSAFMKDGVLSGKTAFRLYDTFGYPLELTMEMAAEKGLTVDVKGYQEAFEAHKEKSRMAGDNVFKGGLADTSEHTVYLHTATHLLMAALRKIFQTNAIHQKGSNITPERLRIDFNFDRKLTDEELAQIEQEVNQNISDSLPVNMEEMTVVKAKEQGAEGVFDSKYSDMVKVYSIGTVSKEICGGPHAKNTSELKSFKILKEESSSAGVRRIKAVIGVC